MHQGLELKKNSTFVKTELEEDQKIAKIDAEKNLREEKLMKHAKICKCLTKWLLENRAYFYIKDRHCRNNSSVNENNRLLK